MTEITTIYDITKEFNSLWTFEDKSIIHFIGIKFLAYFSTGDCEDEHEMELFSLFNDKFTANNLSKQIELHNNEILTREFNGAEVFFRIYSNDKFGCMIGTHSIDVYKICSLIDNNFYEELVTKYSYENENIDESDESDNNNYNDDYYDGYDGYDN